MMARRGLAALLIALMAIPAAASPTTGSPAVAIPIGTFSYSDSTNIGGADALAGTTVFSGDMIEVGPHGSAWIQLNGGTQLRVSSASRLRLKELASSKNQIEMEMFSGAARFRTSEAAPVVARLADATVRAKGASPAVGLVSLLSSKRAIIGAEKGELLVSTAHDSKIVTLREGETVEVLLSDPPAPAPGKPQGTSKSTGASTLSSGKVAIIGLVIGATAIGVGVKLAKDNKGLTDTEKQNMVSPFKFP